MSNNDFSKKQYQYVLILLMLVIGLSLFKYARPYLSGFLGAFTFYALLRGQMKFLHEKKKWSRGLSATIIILEALFIFLIPLTGIGFLVADTISGINIDPEALKVTIYEFIDKVEDTLKIKIFTPENFSFVPKLGTNLVQAIAGSLYSFLINSVIILFVLYFMLYSYDSLETAIREILPFTKENKQTFVSETKLIIQANALGIPLLAIIQSLFAYAGYIVCEVPSPILYTVLTAFASIIPMVGAALVYVPLSISLLVQHEYVYGIGLLLYGSLIVGSVDNVARFILQKKLADIHPLITVFGVVMGIPMFGFWGIIFGPLILSLLILFFNMYRHDYIEGSIAKPVVTTKYMEGQGGGRRKTLLFPMVKKRKAKPKKELEEKEEVEEPPKSPSTDE